jgi:hypothetical protein
MRTNLLRKNISNSKIKKSKLTIAQGNLTLFLTIFVLQLALSKIFQTGEHTSEDERIGPSKSPV